MLLLKPAVVVFYFSPFNLRVGYTFVLTGIELYTGIRIVFQRNKDKNENVEVLQTAGNGHRVSYLDEGATPPGRG